MGMCSFGPGDKSDAELDQHYYSPEATPRGQTDCLCYLIFLACLSLLFGITGWAVFSGDLSRFQGLPDSQGHTCGVTQAVVDKPYLFFCLDASAGISLTQASRVCVAACPASSSESAPCGIIGYASQPYGGMLCLPTKTDQLEDLGATLNKHPSMKVFMEIAEVPKAWVPITCSAVLAIVLAFSYLLLLRKCTCLVWVGLGMMVLVSGMFGLYFAYAGMTGGADGLPSSGDARIDWAVALVSLVLCALFVCIILFKRSSVEMAMDCIKAACECIWDVKSLLFEPFLALAIRCIIFVVLLMGLLLVYTCKTDVITDGNVRFSYSEWQYYIIGFYIFMIIWIMDLSLAMSQFCCSYAVEMWFFSGYNSQSQSKAHPALMFAAIQGYCVALRHHMGSLCIGSFLIAVFHAFQLVIWCLTEAAQSNGNQVVACCLKICNCFIECFRRVIEHINKNAYMDIALNGNSFCPAAYHAMCILTSNATAVAVLKGATWIFELAALGGITAAGAWCTFWTVQTFPEYNDPASANYIAEPVIVCAVSGVVCFLVALPFVIVLGQSADTILFCFAVDKKRNPEKTAEEHTSGGLTWLSSLFFGGSSARGGKKGETEMDAHPPETQALLKNLGARTNSE